MQSDDSTPVARILLVEDEAIIAHDLKRRLERLGYEVVGITDNGEDALALAAKRRPSLVFMDIVIQGAIDGIETAARMRPLLDVPIVFLTAHADPATIERAKQVGPYGYLVKPFEERELQTTIEMALFRHATEARARFLEHAISSAGTAIAVIDARQPRRPITLCNAAFERITGYSSEEILGRPASFLMGRHTDASAAEVVRLALERREACQLTFRLDRKDGGQFWSDLSLSPVRDAAGDVTHLLCFHSDVTRRRQTEEALLQAQKMEAVGQLTGGIAHDFNNLLTTILAFGGFARDALPEGSAGRADIMEVLSAARRATDMTRQLLTFSRQQPSSRRPVDLNESLAGLLKLLRRTVGADIEVEVSPSSRSAIVNMDPVQFDQVVLNLAVNARDAMPRGGSLRLALSHPSPAEEPSRGRVVRLTARDTGVGMDPATVARVFEPFFTTKPVGKGTGLGLATCFTIVQDAGGDIRIDSAPGEGTTFTVDLPVCDEPVEDDSLSSLPGITAAGERVLVVEDDASLRRAATRSLRSAGYDVVEADDGHEAIAMLDQLGPTLDLVISDVVMPGPSGFAVAEHARTSAPTAGVLLMSGYIERPAAADFDAEAILWKPYTEAGLLRAAHRALTQGESRAHLGRPRTVRAPRGRVLVVEDDEMGRVAMERVLGEEGYDITSVGSIAGAQEAVAASDGYVAVLCDLTLEDGSGADFVWWLREFHPEQARRALVLTGGVVDQAGRDLVAEDRTEVLRKPIDPLRLVHRVGALARLPSRRDADPGPQRVDCPVVEASEPSDTSCELTVLLVDDEPAQRDACARILGGAGYAVCLAGSGEEALDRLAERAFDVVATDIGLPGLDGLGVLRAVRDIDPDLPVLLITGAPSVQTATMAVQSRAVGYLAKPFEPPELLAEVERAIEAGQVARLQRKLLAAHAGADEFLHDLAGTERAFSQALEQLRMVYQPIVRSHDHSVYAYEALLRSDAPGFTTPPRLLAAAEVLDRIEDVGLAVRSAVERTLTELPPGLEAIFVNLHPSELRSELLCASTEPLLRHASRVVLEVTERASLSMGPQVLAGVQRLREAGYRVAIDDLGEGYAGLSWLAQLKPDIAKIDMSLVRNAHQSPLKQQILGSLVRVCRHAGITTVAEGIECKEEVALLTDLGCDLLQGYYFAKPGPPFPVVRGEPGP